MKKTFNSQSKLSLFVAIAFLLQGCCFLPDFSVARKKSCNCNDSNKPVYAVNNNNTSLSQPEAFQEAFQPVLTSNTERSKNSSGQASVIEEPVNLWVDISDDSMKESLQAVQTLSNMLKPYLNNPREGNTQNDDLISDQTSRRKTSAKKLPFGIKGINTSLIASPNISFKSSKEDYGDTDHKHKAGIGFQFGIGTTYTFTKNFAVSTSLVFKQNNASETLRYSSPGEPGSNPFTEEYESKYSYSYLSVPILAEVKLSDQLTATVGPEINYLLDASVKSNGYGNDKTNITKNSVKVGTGIQLGIKYGIPGSPLAVQLLYDHRISRLNEKNEADSYPGSSNEIPAWNMKSIQLGVTCSLCELLKKK